MAGHIVNAAISLGSGAVAAQQQIPGLDTAIEKAGLAVITTVIIYWLLFNFSKRLDKLTDAIDKLSDHVREKE